MLFETFTSQSNSVSGIHVVAFSVISNRWASRNESTLEKMMKQPGEKDYWSSTENCPQPTQACSCCCCWHIHRLPRIQLPCSRLPANSPKLSPAHSYPPSLFGDRQSPTAWGGRVGMKLTGAEAVRQKCKHPRCAWSQWKNANVCDKMTETDKYLLYIAGHLHKPSIPRLLSNKHNFQVS